MMFHGPLIALFLMLVATSAAVVGSMIVLALLDLVFGKKSKPPLVADVVEDVSEDDRTVSPAKLRNSVTVPRPKIKALRAPGSGYQTKRKPQPGYGPHTQRVIPFDMESMGR